MRSARMRAITAVIDVCNDVVSVGDSTFSHDVRSIMSTLGDEEDDVETLVWEVPTKVEQTLSIAEEWNLSRRAEEYTP